MKRLLFNLMSLLSLVLLAATVVLWIRSYFVRDVIFWRSSQWQDGNVKCLAEGEIHSGCGGVGIYRQLNWSDDADYLASHSVPKVVHSTRRPPVLPSLQALSFAVDGKFSYAERTAQNMHVAFPLWLAAMAFAVLPAWWGWRRYEGRIIRRRSSGLCVHCGYDLRATPDRCPECGTAYGMDIETKT